MSERIRWEEMPNGTLWGYVGTLRPAAFQVTPTRGLAALGGKWELGSDLPGQEGRHPSGDNRETVKSAADDLLADFISSLGAIFPDALRVAIRQERDTRSRAALAVDPEWAAERHFGWVDALDWTSALIDEPAKGAGR